MVLIAFSVSAIEPVYCVFLILRKLVNHGARSLT
jgi:hypothetical protein